MVNIANNSRYYCENVVPPENHEKGQLLLSQIRIRLPGANSFLLSEMPEKNRGMKISELDIHV